MDQQYILIVEDESELLEMYLESISIKGYKLLSATSGLAAFEICKEHKNNIKMVISDSNMPEMNGMELLNNLKGYYNKMPIFYLLTGAFEFNLADIKKAGGHDLILKPFDLDYVITKIKKDLNC